MDAGNFNLNFGNVGGPNRFQKAPGPNQNQEAERAAEDKGPLDGVDFGVFSRPEVNLDMPAEVPQLSEEVVKPGSLGKTEPTFSLSAPLTLNSIGAVSSTSGISPVDTGITALNGINSTSLFSLGGKTLASVNPFNPVTLTSLPTTSVATNGLESTNFFTISGKPVGEVRMPTTSIGTNGLEDTSWTTFNGRTITLH